MTLVGVGQGFERHSSRNIWRRVAVFFIVYGQTIAALVAGYKSVHVNFFFHLAHVFFLRIKLPEIQFAQLDQQWGNHFLFHISRISVMDNIVGIKVFGIQNIEMIARRWSISRTLLDHDRRE